MQKVKQKGVIFLRYIVSLGIKFLLVNTVILSVLGIFSNTTFTALLTMGILITIASFVIGDLIILPRMGIVTSTIIDFALYFLAVWYLAGIFIGFDQGVLLMILMTAYFLTLAEPFYHAYVLERVFNRVVTREQRPAPQLQTEFAEEKVVSLDDFQQSKHEEDNQNVETEKREKDR